MIRRLTEVVGWERLKAGDSPRFSNNQALCRCESLSKASAGPTEGPLTLFPNPDLKELGFGLGYGFRRKVFLTGPGSSGWQRDPWGLGMVQGEEVTWPPKSFPKSWYGEGLFSPLHT